MNGKIFAFAALAVASLLLVVSVDGKQESGAQGSSQDEAAIRQKTTSYQEAFNRRDVDALSRFYADDAVYLGLFSGFEAVGREAIGQHMGALFEQIEVPNLDLQIESISFPGKDEAVVRGLVVLKYSDGTKLEDGVNIFYDRVDGEWQIVRLSESEKPTSQFAHLKELEWLVGDFVDEDEQATIEISTQWDRYRNFLTQNFKISADGRLEMEVRQVITWDPIHERMRSWVFDSDGGFGEGVWSKKGDSWVVHQGSTLADGRRASAINQYTMISSHGYTWVSTGREVDGAILPDVGPIKILKKNGQEEKL